MKKNNKGFIGITLLFIGAVVLAGSLVYLGSKLEKSQNLSASFTPVQTGKTTLSGAGITSSANTINLTSLMLNDGITPIYMSNFGDVGFATIEPGVPKKEENVSFTGITQNANGTAVLTGVLRGLLPVYPYSASSSLAIAHSGGVMLIISNSGAFYNQFAIANNTTTVQANWTFNSSSIPRFTSDTTNAQIAANGQNLVNYNTLASTSFVGAVNADLTHAGLVQLGTTAQIASGTSLGSTGASLFASGGLYGSSSTARIQIPVTDSNGKLDKNFINTSANYTFTGSNTLASTTFTATTTFLGMVDLSSAVVSSTMGNRVVFTASSIWTVPTGTTNIFLTMIGGGGGGASGDSVGSCGGGGGGGAGSILRLATSTTPGTTITITVGNGGAGGTTATSTAGSNGTASTVNTISAGGGNGALACVSSATSAGGTLGSSSISHFNGDSGANNSGNTPGGGGGGWFSLATPAVGNNATGTAGKNFGSGGGGGGDSASVIHAGGSGANGVVIIEW